MDKIIFVGTTDFGIPTLEMLKRNYDLEMVITQPDRPYGRKKILTPPPVKSWAQAHGIKILQPEKIAEAADAIKSISPAIIVVAAYGQIIPAAILNLAGQGSINIHSSLLPKYRGASPIQAAIMNDDEQTGVTLIIMDEKMDHGPVISQEAILIEEKDDYLSLHSRLAELGAQMLEKTLPEFLSGTIKPRVQEHAQATFVKTITRQDARIDWTNPARTILQKIKALNPEPGTWTTLDKKSVKIIKAEELKKGGIDLPGKIYADGKDCLVKCGDYSLKLVLVQPEGKTPISGQDFLNGLKNLETKVFV